MKTTHVKRSCHMCVICGSRIYEDSDWEWARSKDGKYHYWHAECAEHEAQLLDPERKPTRN